MNEEVGNMVVKKRDKKKLVIGLISTLTVMTIVCIALLVGINYLRLNRISIDEDELYQYFNGSKFEYKGKITIKNNGEVSSIITDDLKIDKNEYPIYYKNKPNQVIFPIYMEVIVLKDINKTKKINYFTNIELAEDGTSAYVVYKDKKLFLDESFLYDGDNLYFFVYPVNVKIGDTDYNLQSGSYMIVNYKDQVEIYDKKEDKYTIIDSYDGDVIANLNGIEINLSVDMIITNSGNRLLIKNVKNLPLYE